MRKHVVRGFVAAVAAASLSGHARAQNAANDDDVSAEIIVTGTREANRTVFEALAPVDVLNDEAIQASASNEVSDALAQVVPSFNVQRLPLADGLVFVRPATLRNLSPDQTLVLINGKRLHRSALLGARGAQAPDFAQIPSFAIERIEILRDGASAQYGSDAIAGVINVILKDDPGYAGFGQWGQYYEGDGANYRLGARAGWTIGDDGFFTASAEWATSDATSRTRQRPDAIAFQAANPTLRVPNPVQRWGQPELDALRVALNAELPLSASASLYGLATYGQGEGVSDFNWRNPVGTASVFNPSTAFPGFSFRTLYPTGFTPIFGQEDQDYQLVGGVRGAWSEAFSYDFSVSNGANEIQYSLENSLNASLGPASPTSFKPGTLNQSETNLNADFVYRLSIGGFTEPLNIAFGAERREEVYKITAGDPASYAIGPGAATGLAPNSNGFPGFSPRQAGEFDQTSHAAYLDIEASPFTALTLGAAIRYEDFSEFGSTTDYKIAGRFAFSDDVAARASYSTGFRAPTPGQLFSTATTQGLDTRTLQIFNTGRLSPSDPLARALGAQPLQPEEAETLSGGLTWRSGFGLSGSIDAYRIEVQDRFAQSATRAVPAGTPNPDRFTGVSFFTNAFDTKTQGVDVVVNYETDLGPGALNATIALNFNETTVEGGTTSLVTNAEQRRVFEEGRPQNNATSAIGYEFGRFKLDARARYYGPWTDSTGNTTGLIFQEFGSITLVDLSASVRVTDALSVRIGAENAFDTYPDEAIFQANRGLIYSRNAPYDTDGGQYYVRLDAQF
jgi:iron complex outermembrane receptor protein